MKKELPDLIKIAQQFNQRPDLVQGAGGNLSVKLDDRQMLIKASGLRFSELSGSQGFVTVDYAKLQTRYSQERAFIAEEESQFLLSCAVGGRPSMEAGFHAFLGKYVLHSHSVYANVLTCSTQGQPIALDICQGLGIDAAYLDYFNPGPDLAAAVYRLIRDRGSVPSVIFLGNHGLIVSDSSADGVLALHQTVNDRIKQTLKLEEYPAVGGNLSEADYARLKDVILFPDQAVFCADLPRPIVADPSEGSKALMIAEIAAAQNYILSSIARLQLSPRTLSQQAVAYLTNMEAEKHRRSLIH